MFKTKKLLIGIITLFAVLSLSTMAFDGGSGTKNSPYEIANASHLSELAELSENNSLDGVYFLQTADIDLSDVDFSVIAENKNYPFMGSYDGNDYEIIGAQISSNKDASALFGYAKDAQLKNIKLKHVTVTVAPTSAGICANVYGNTAVTKCEATVSFILPSQPLFGVYAGAIAGYIEPDAQVSNCVSDITADFDTSAFSMYLGGIAGSNKGLLSSNASNVNISVVSDKFLCSVGAIAGQNEGRVEGCASAGAIQGAININSANLYIGGIAGENKGVIERSLNKTSITSNGYGSYASYAGGIVGLNQDGTVKVSNNAASVSGALSFAGGISGLAHAFEGDSNITDCLNTGSVTFNSGIVGGLVGKSMAADAEKILTTSVTSSLNLAQLSFGKASIGEIELAGNGSSEEENLVVRNATDDYARRMTDAQLVSATNISGLVSDAWVYYNQGFMPSLATVKNLGNMEVIATSLDKTSGKAAYTVYNPDGATNAVALIYFIKDNRHYGAKIVDISVQSGYNAFVAESTLIKTADEVKITVLKSITGLVPMTELAKF